jgi:hypothetical protein
MKSQISILVKGKSLDALDILISASNSESNDWENKYIKYHELNWNNIKDEINDLIEYCRLKTKLTCLQRKYNHSITADRNSEQWVIGDHKFDTLEEIEKVLKMKEFL